MDLDAHISVPGPALTPGVAPNDISLQVSLPSLHCGEGWTPHIGLGTIK